MTLTTLPPLIPRGPCCPDLDGWAAYHKDDLEPPRCVPGGAAIGTACEIIDCEVSIFPATPSPASPLWEWIGPWHPLPDEQVYPRRP